MIEKTIRLRWPSQPVTEVTSYIVKVGTTSGAYDLVIDPAIVATVSVDGVPHAQTDVDVTEFGTYYIVVIAVDEEGTPSEPSNEVAAVVAPTPPSAPEVMVVSVI
jgi:hypothetical protein